MASDAKVSKFVKPITTKKSTEETVVGEVRKVAEEEVERRPSKKSRGDQVRDLFKEFCYGAGKEFGVHITDEDEGTYWVHNGNRVDPRSRVVSVHNGYFVTWYSERVREVAYNAHPTLRGLIVDLDAA